MDVIDVNTAALPCRLLPVSTRGTPLPDGAAELEALARECRRFADGEAYARSAAPVGTEPRVSYTVLDTAGNPYSATAHYPEGLRAGDRVVAHTPSARRSKRWQAHAAAHERARAVYAALAATPLMRYRPMSEFPPFPALPRKVAAAVGALRFAALEPGAAVPWLPGYAMGGRGFEFLLADGMVFLDAGDTEDGVYVSQIAVAPQRTGLGRRVMLALRRYCDERNRRLVVYKVAAPGFFAALGWLQRHPRFTEFTYEPWQPEPMRPPVAGAGRPREEQGVVISINVASA